MKLLKDKITFSGSWRCSTTGSKAQVWAGALNFLKGGFTNVFFFVFFTYFNKYVNLKVLPDSYFSINHQGIFVINVLNKCVEPHSTYLVNSYWLLLVSLLNCDYLEMSIAIGLLFRGVQCLTFSKC